MYKQWICYECGHTWIGSDIFSTYPLFCIYCGDEDIGENFMSLDPTELIEGEDTEGQSGVESEGGDTSGSGTAETSPPDATADPGTGGTVSE